MNGPLEATVILNRRAKQKRDLRSLAGVLGGFAVLAGFCVACAGPTRSTDKAKPGPASAAAPLRPAFDIDGILGPDLLRKANHGRSVVGSDGRFVLPAAVRRASVDVGAHLLEGTRAIMQSQRDLALFAIEPMEECWAVWPNNPRLIALPVAVSTDRGVMDFNVNAKTATSSLLKSVAGADISALTRTKEVRKVPVLRLEDILERIPATVEIEILKTDVQGLDLQVLKSAGSQIQRVRRVKAEVINQHLYDGQGALRPGTEAEFVSYMESQGFRFERDSDVRPGRAWLDKHFVNTRFERNSR
jgi:FkbM family methyltransferase